MYLLDQVLPATGDMILVFYRDLVLHCGAGCAQHVSVIPVLCVYVCTRLRTSRYRRRDPCCRVLMLYVCGAECAQWAMYHPV